MLIFPAFAFGKKWGYLAIIYTVIMGFALVYMGEHFVTDLVVGFMCAAYGWYGAGAWWDIAAPNVLGKQESDGRAHPERLGVSGRRGIRSLNRAVLCGGRNQHVEKSLKGIGARNIPPDPHRSRHLQDAALRDRNRPETRFRPDPDRL